MTATQGAATAALIYVAVGPNAYGFGVTRQQAIERCKPNIPWGLIPRTRKDAVVMSYAYLPEQDVAVSKIDGSLSWQHPDNYDVRASLEETIVARPKEY